MNLTAEQLQIASMIDAKMQDDCGDLLGSRLEIVLVKLFFLGCAIASEQQTTPGVLVIDVYSVMIVPSDVIREKDFMMWARELKDTVLWKENYAKATYDLADLRSIVTPARSVPAGI